ncbi:MAG: hypothetical protein IRY87_03350 [Acetobacteraceae bacterium]|nr:hypothetical protein [Acetobacteraceae bacterium]
MPERRAVILALPFLTLAACAQTGLGEGPPVPAALRFATALEGADQAVDDAVDRMDGFERMAERENAAIAYATGGQRGGIARFTPPPAGAAEAAGRVLDPAFAALGDYGHVLAQVASGQPVLPRPSVSGVQLARAAEAGLQAVRAASGTPVAEPVRDAGLAGITALANLPRVLAQRGRPVTVAALVEEAQPHVAAVAAMLRAVIGPEPGQGTRGALRARREALDASQERFLEALRKDRRIGPGERYSIFRSISELRDADPAEGTFAALIDLLATMEQAHAALGAGSPEAAARVTAFEVAVARLAALSEASRRG